MSSISYDAFMFVFTTIAELGGVALGGIPDC